MIKAFLNSRYATPVISFLCGCIFVLGILFTLNNCSNHTSTKRVVDEHEYVDSAKTYHKVYYDKEISALKTENKALYDSIKAYKNEVSYLLQFKYSKNYSTGVVEIYHTDTVIQKIVEENNLVAQTYEYKGEPSDTLQYDLKVNSYTEPLWYSINFKTTDQFTIVNRNVDGVNQLTVDSYGDGDISGVTAFHKKEKKNIFNKLFIGPVVTYGYDINQKKCGIMVGGAIGYNLFGK